MGNRRLKNWGSVSMDDDDSCMVFNLKGAKKVKVCQKGNEIKVEDMQCDVCSG
jgi:hypothetical protein